MRRGLVIVMALSGWLVSASPAWALSCADVRFEDVLDDPAIVSVIEARRVLSVPGLVPGVSGGKEVVEPVAGSTGVLVPPLGYLERLRAICDRHGLLLVFDEVITGFGRLGAMFAAQAFGVVPDMIVFAKAVTNGAAPMGGVIVRREIHDALMQGPPHLAELMHGYTCSAHPLACAAAGAMLDVIRDEDLLARVRALAPVFERVAHALADAPGVVSVRNVGLAAGIELAPYDAAHGGAGARGAAAQAAAFDHGVLTRVPGDTLVFAPPFVTGPGDLDRMADRLRAAIVATAAPPRR